MEQILLVKKAIAGNEKAFEELVKSQSEKLYKTAFLYVRNKEDALDVLQETIYKAYISVNQVEKPEYFNTWLTKILIRTSFDILKKRKKIVLDDTLLESPDENRRMSMEGKMDLINAISSLNSDYRTVIILFYYQDLPIYDIARTMEKPENTIKTYLRRAKLELRKKLEGGDFREQGAY
ncbi:sigma-70 family RNA polymerase sigma factor [Radiobacillus deserti]|uniref:Sigma-70 family RNA polymerase sigma factor n=1 Tax=Radiobacillus deserti TaxID=2594883 RepID=A0A516KIB2_9BACI|nr:sigma-70 family RNA polymerase sigma factor [Radiobacillus deserti]QDP41129.1 sigma-70 family RNA polymerase sigma factor [Radiobacillus deserti]